MNFVNNWSQAITLAADAGDCPLALPDGEYLLTITDSATKPTAWEIVRAQVVGGYAYLARGRENTTARAWPAGSLIYCSITAGTFADLFDLVDASTRQVQSQAQAISALEARIATLEGGVTLGSAFNEPNRFYGFTKNPNDYSYPLGQVTPEGASTIPGADASPGAAGELISMQYGADFGSFIVAVRGPYTTKADLPFTSFKVGSREFNVADFGDLSDRGNGIVSMFMSVSENPVPVGPLKLSFS